MTKKELAEAKVKTLDVMALTGEEHLLIACHLFEADRRRFISSLPLGLDKIEIARALCQHYYGDEVDVEAFVAHLKRRAGKTK